MASGDRFYLLEFPSRPALWGDLGSQLRIRGLLIGGSAQSVLLLLPETPKQEIVATHELNDAEWCDVIRRLDDPEILVGNGHAKIFQRKLRHAISGAVQQKIWAADKFACVYCGARMGETMLSIDHFVPLELGGSHSQDNYVSACRRCNKSKGCESPDTWCPRYGYDASKIREYLKQRKVA